jgi:hypothetical protein
MRTGRRTAQAVTAAAAAKGTSAGPIGVGCRFTQRTKSFGQVGDTVTELIRYERPRHLASMVAPQLCTWKGTSPPTGRLRLRRDGGPGTSCGAETGRGYSGHWWDAQDAVSNVGPGI